MIFLNERRKESWDFSRLCSSWRKQERNLKQPRTAAGSDVQQHVQSAPSPLEGCWLMPDLAKGEQLPWKSLSSQISVNFCISLFLSLISEARIFLHFTSHEAIPASWNCTCWAQLIRFAYIHYHLCCVSSKVHRRAPGKAYMHSFSWETWYLFCSRPGQTNPLWNSRITLLVKGFVSKIIIQLFSNAWALEVNEYPLGWLIVLISRHCELHILHRAKISMRQTEDNILFFVS